MLTKPILAAPGFGYGLYYSIARCLAEQSNIHGAIAQLVERFVRIEEVVVSITISSTTRVVCIPPQTALLHTQGIVARGVAKRHIPAYRVDACAYIRHYARVTTAAYLR